MNTPLLDSGSNPFRKIVTEFTEDYVTLTIETLNRCKQHLEEVGQYYSIDEVFSILQFLEEARVLSIKRNANKSFEVKLNNG